MASQMEGQLNVSGFITNITNSSETNNSTHWSFTYRLVCLYILTALGILGNALSLIVLLKSSKRRHSSRLYLIVLAVIDSLVLICELLSRGGAADVNDWACSSVTYIRYVMKSFSAYIVVIISIDRFVMVIFPYQAIRYGRLKIALIHIGTAFLFAVVSNIYATFTQAIHKKYKICHAKVEYADLYAYSYFSLHFLLAELGASTVVFTLTVITIYGLYRSRKVSQQLRGIRFMNEVTPTNIDLHLTEMLIAIALVFVVLRLPYSIVWLYDFLYYDVTGHKEDSTRKYIYSAINILLTFSVANFAVNFLVYFTFWKSFRHQLWNILTLKCSEKYRQETSTLSYNRNTNIEHESNT